MEQRQPSETAATVRSHRPGAGSDVEELLTLEDVCRLFKLKRSYIYHLTHRNRVPHIKIGNHLRFRQSDLVTWLAAQTHALPDDD